MLTISREEQISKQIDRACAAQSSEMMPQLPPSPEELRAKKKIMEDRINAKFGNK